MLSHLFPRIQKYHELFIVHNYDSIKPALAELGLSIKILRINKVLQFMSLSVNSMHYIPDHQSSWPPEENPLTLKTS